MIILMNSLLHKILLSFERRNIIFPRLFLTPKFFIIFLNTSHTAIINCISIFVGFVWNRRTRLVNFYHIFFRC